MPNASQAQKDYYAKNKAVAVEKEKKADYEAFGSRGDAARKGMEEGRMDAMGTAYKKGGEVNSPTMKFETYTKTGKPAGMKTVTMAKGGSVSSRADGCCVKGKTRGKIC
jgi:hypothetical protein